MIYSKDISDKKVCVWKDSFLGQYLPYVACAMTEEVIKYFLLAHKPHMARIYIFVLKHKFYFLNIRIGIIFEYNMPFLMTCLVSTSIIWIMVHGRGYTWSWW